MRRDGPGARRFAAKRGRLSRVSAKRAEQADDEAQVREAVFARDGHRCVLQVWVGEPVPHDAPLDPDDLDADWFATVPGCYGPLTFGHRRHASAGGAYITENGNALCLGHNRWCEDEPDAARALGQETPWWLVVREGDPEWHLLGRKANGVH